METESSWPLLNGERSVAEYPPRAPYSVASSVITTYHYMRIAGTQGMPHASATVYGPSVAGGASSTMALAGVPPSTPMSGKFTHAEFVEALCPNGATSSSRPPGAHRWISPIRCSPSFRSMQASAIRDAGALSRNLSSRIAQGSHARDYVPGGLLNGHFEDVQTIGALLCATNLAHVEELTPSLILAHRGADAEKQVMTTHKTAQVVESQKSEILQGVPRVFPLTAYPSQLHPLTGNCLPNEEIISECFSTVQLASKGQHHCRTSGLPKASPSATGAVECQGEHISNEYSSHAAPSHEPLFDETTVAEFVPSLSKLSNTITIPHPNEDSILENVLAANRWPRRTHSRKKCETCGRIFGSARKLLNHKNSVHKGLRYRCPSCPSSYCAKAKLNKHLKEFHGVRNVHACEHEGCFVRFAKYRDLLRHRTMEHYGEHPFRCAKKSCGKRFDCRTSFDAHQKFIHSGPHSPCTARFPSMRTVSRH